MKLGLDGYKCILLFNLKEQLPTDLQNVNEVNRECSHLAAASSVCDSTYHNGLLTKWLASGFQISFIIQTISNPTSLHPCEIQISDPHCIFLTTGMLFCEFSS